MVRGCPYDWQACSEVHSVIEVESLERCQSLVMVHGKCRVEFAVVGQTEESVRGVRSESHDTFIIGGLDCRCDNGFLFVSEKSVVSAVRIQSEYGDFRLGDAEIASERSVHDAQFGKNLLLGDA